MHKPSEKKVPHVPSNRPFKDLKKEVLIPVVKKNILVTFGIGDTFCDKNSPRFLKAGEKILNDTRSLVKENKRRYSGYLNILEFNDSNRSANPFVYDTGGVKGSRIIDLKMYSPLVFDDMNVLNIKASKISDNGAAMKASNIDVLLPPEENNLFICGIDINGAFMNGIDQLISWGYLLTVYSDIIKPYSKETIEFLIEKSKDRGNHLRFGKS